MKEIMLTGVPDVKNPISLARVILLDSISPHTIQPCPPNLLCGVAATKYAQERRLVVVPNKDLLAPSAWERHRRWMYEAHCMANDIPVSSSSHSMAVPAEPAPVARITMGNDDDAGFPRAESSIGGIFDAENPDSTCLGTEPMAEVSTDPEGQYPPAEIRGLFETPSTPPPLTPRSHAVIYTGRALVEEERPHRPLLPTAISVADIPTPATAVGSASMKPGERISHSVSRFDGQQPSSFHFV